MKQIYKQRARSTHVSSQLALQTSSTTHVFSPIYLYLLHTFFHSSALLTDAYVNSSAALQSPSWERCFVFLSPIHCLFRASNSNSPNVMQSTRDTTTTQLNATTSTTYAFITKIHPLRPTAVCLPLLKPKNNFVSFNKIRIFINELLKVQGRCYSVTQGQVQCILTYVCMNVCMYKHTYVFVLLMYIHICMYSG